MRLPHQAGGSYLGIVKVEGVVIVEIRLDGVEVEEHVIELLEEEEAGGHALPAGDGVTLRGTAAHQLEILLCDLQVLPLQSHTRYQVIIIIIIITITNLLCDPHIYWLN